MAVTRIAFTGYPVKDMARSRAFYEGALGLSATNDFEGRWVEYHLDNGCFAVTTMFEGAPGGAGIAFEVDDVDAVHAGLKAKGAKVLAEPFATPVCRMSVVADPDGHSVTLHRKSAGR
jgi:predicted enzyme related to lactoylglutathione lyase